jgi:hypothetical protein
MLISQKLFLLMEVSKYFQIPIKFFELCNSKGVINVTT